MSLHGGCPVLNGTKLAANLWTWNGVRPEYEGAPLKRELRPDEIKATAQIVAEFHNSGKDPQFQKAEVYYDEDGFFGKLGFGDPPVFVNTYVGHVWNVKQVDGEAKKTFVIEEGGGERQVFTV
jgi:hypothetical protein